MTLQAPAAKKEPPFDFSDSAQDDYEIEHNIPIPPKRSGGANLYPFDKMKVGDSFFAPGKKSSSVGGSARTWVERNGGKAHFTVRQIGTDGCRCWRDK